MFPGRSITDSRAPRMLRAFATGRRGSQFQGTTFFPPGSGPKPKDAPELRRPSLPAAHPATSASPRIPEPAQRGRAVCGSVLNAAVAQPDSAEANPVFERIRPESLHQRSAKHGGSRAPEPAPPRRATSARLHDAGPGRLYDAAGAGCP